jgi:hypothetical protein
MILLHTDPNKCNEALKLYINGIEDLKLLHHESSALELDSYDRKFWSAKAKPIYKWYANFQTNKNVPWLSFVGYQIRRDGLIRVRRASILKEKKKIVNERMRVLKAIGFYRRNNHYKDVVKNIKLPRKNIVYRLQNRYVSMSVGKIDLRGTRTLKDDKIHTTNKILSQGFCWTNGFKLLKKNPVVSKQLKDLDRFRNYNIKLLNNYLRHIEISTNTTIGVQDKKTAKEIKTRYFGNPFSYHYFLSSKENTYENNETNFC